MSGIITPRQAQIQAIASQIGQATAGILRAEGATAFTFCFVMWQQDQPVSADRLIITVPPGTDMQELDEVLATLRTLVQTKKGE